MYKKMFGVAGTVFPHWLASLFAPLLERIKLSDKDNPTTTTTNMHDKSCPTHMHNLNIKHSYSEMEDTRKRIRHEKEGWDMNRREGVQICLYEQWEWRVGKLSLFYFGVELS